jgi:outer membrane receptor protein involved in Fe transport
VTLSGDRSDHAAMFSAKLQYKINPAVMVYLSYARGFKSGGFNVGDTSGVAANIPYSPEHVNAYEAGLKSIWFDDQLLMNLAVFRSDYSDLQVAVNSTTPTGAIISRVRNAAESRSQGVELESRWAVSRNFRLAAEVSYLDSRYRNYQSVTPTSLQSFNHIPAQDLSGRPTEFAPKWSANLNQTYTLAVTDRYEMLGELTEYFTSRYFYAPTDDPLLEQGGYGRLDARLGFQPSDSKWGIDLIGKNLTDRNVAMFGQYLSTSLGSVVVQKEQPRSVVIQARYHW